MVKLNSQIGKNMTNVKFYNTPSNLAMSLIQNMLTLYPSEIVYMDNEVWAYWTKYSKGQILEIAESAQEQGMNFEWYEKAGIYEGMVYIQIYD